MKVVIDGVQYMPMPELQTDKGLLAALAMRFDSDAGPGITMRDYLFLLLSNVWEEGESFSAKRPFGNSGWQWQVYGALAEAGFIEATLADGEIIDMTPDQERTACAYVGRLINAALYGVQES